jgi:hypothetical protein
MTSDGALAVEPDDLAVDRASAALEMSLSAGRPERAPPTEADRFAGTAAVATRTPAVHRHHQRIRRSPKRPTGPTSNMPGDDRAPVHANGHDEPVEAWSEPLITVRAAAGACGVTPTAVRGWLADGRIGDPPWTVEQLESVRDRPSSRARGAKAAHGTVVRYAEGCSCDRCRTAEMIGRGTGNERRQTPVSLSRLASSFSPSYSLATFHAVLRDLGITANLVWGRARRDPDWAADFDAVLLATRREELEHGTNAAYVQGCVRPDCRAHQLRRMAKGKLNNCGC